MNKRPILDLGLACLLIGVGVASRLVPHPPNFTAVGSMALFASFYLGGRKLGPIVILGTMLISDIVIGTYEPALMAAVYASSLLPLLLGRVLRRRVTVGRVASCAVISSVAFFVTTNFAVWLIGDWYANDWSGLVACYAAAVPFFRYTLCSDLLFSGLFFGSYAVLQSRAFVAQTATPELIRNIG